MKKIFIFFFVFLALFTPFVTGAFFDKIEETIIVPQGEIISGDFIRFGNVIEINGDVSGDVIAFGSNITVNGNVRGDVIVMASILKIDGHVMGNVRAAAGTVEVSGTVDKNVNLFSGNTNFLEGSKISGELYAAGGVLQSKGEIEKNMYVRGGQVVLDGTVGGNAYIRIEGKNKVVAGENTKIGGQLEYLTPLSDQLNLHENAVVSGGVNHTEVISKDFGKKAVKSALLFAKIVSLFGLLVVGLVLVTLMPKALLQMSDEMLKRPGKNILRGLVVFIVVPAVVVMLFFTIIGIPVALMLVPLYLISLYVGKVVAGIVFGIFLLKSFKKKENSSPKLMGPMILGLIVLVVVTNVPYAGWAVSLLAVFWALGGIFEFQKKLLASWK